MENQKGGNGYENGQITSPAYVGLCTVVPSSTTSYARSSNAQGYQQVAKMNQENKVTGGYERYTAKEEVTTGAPYRSGVKDEYKSSSTYKVGDKSGYTEYYTEEKVRNVYYGRK